MELKDVPTEALEAELQRRRKGQKRTHRWEFLSKSPVEHNGNRGYHVKNLEDGSEGFVSGGGIEKAVQRWLDEGVYKLLVQWEPHPQSGTLYWVERLDKKL